MKVLAATFMAKLFVDTIGAVDPFGGKGVFLPPPARYLATFLLWAILGVWAGFGPRASRLAGRLSAVVLLTAMVLGPFGPKFVAFLAAATKFFPSTEEATS